MKGNASLHRVRHTILCPSNVINLLSYGLIQTLTLMDFFFCGKTLMEDLINEKWNSEKLKKLHQAIVGHVIVQQYHT
jgi:hypothetical protein